MPAFADLSLLDGAATPVARTFGRVKIDANGVASFADRAGGIAMGYPTLSVALRMPSKASRNFKQTTRLALPTLEVTSPNTSTGIQPGPTLAYVNASSVDMTFSERSTALERNHLYKLTISALTNAMIADMVRNGEGVW